MENSRQLNETAFGQTTSLAAATPLLCAVHCFAAPVLVLFAPAFVVNAAVEFALMVGTGVIATMLLGWGIRRHGNALVAVPVLAGLAIWVTSELAGSHGATALAMHATGGLLMAGGLTWNSWIRHRGGCRGCLADAGAGGGDPEEPLAEAA